MTPSELKSQLETELARVTQEATELWKPISEMEQQIAPARKLWYAAQMRKQQLEEKLKTLAAMAKMEKELR